MPPFFEEPPGDGWSLWKDQAKYKAVEQSLDFQLVLQNRCLEIWMVGWGNDTRFISADKVPLRLNISGLWWRPA